MQTFYDDAIIAAIGAFLVVYGIGKINERKKLLASGIRVEGTVIRLEHDSDGAHLPVVKYYANNQWIIKKYEVSSSNAKYRIGDDGAVIYDTQDNAHFIIDNTITRQIGPILILTGIGMLIAAGAYCLKLIV